METQNDNNYTIVGLIQEDISKIIGYKGNTLYKNVIEKSMNNLKGLTNHKSQAFIDRINSGEPDHLKPEDAIVALSCIILIASNTEITLLFIF